MPVTDLRQYDKQFKVVNDGTNGDDDSQRVWELCILGKRGQIYPHGKNGSLAVSITSTHTYHKVCALLKVTPHEAASGDEFVIHFENKPELVSLVAAAIRARKSRKGRGPVRTPEQIAAATARLKAWRERQKPVPNPDSNP